MLLTFKNFASNFIEEIKNFNKNCIIFMEDFSCTCTSAEKKFCNLSSAVDFNPPLKEFSSYFVE